MTMFSIADDFIRAVTLRSDWGALNDALAFATRRMGFHYFAAIHHIDFLAGQPSGMRLHNYPDAVVARFDAERRGPSDPIHRASHVTTNGFLWRDVPRMIALSPRDRAVLREAREAGIGDGYTKPANVPGEARGSISFAVETGSRLPREMLHCAHIIGDFAFEAARHAARPCRVPLPRVTDRQLECIIWLGRGKTDREIARQLGVEPSTVIEHLRNVRAAWEASARAVLPLRALVEGLLCIGDFFPGASPFLGML